MKIKRFIALSLCSSILLGSSMMLNSIADDAVNEVSSCSLNKTDESSIKKLTKEQVKEDIDCILKAVKDSGILTSKEISSEVENQRSLEIDKLSDEVNVVDEYNAIVRILSKIDNSQTMLESYASSRKLPININIDNKKFVCTDEELKDFKISHINGVSVDELYNKFKSNFPEGLDEWTYNSFFESQKGFISDYKLKLSGVDINNPIKLTLVRGEEKIEKELNLVDMNKSDLVNDSWTAYSINKDNSVGILKLIGCDSNEKCSKLTDDMFKNTKENNLKDIMIDLRNANKRLSKIESNFIQNMKDIWGIDLSSPDMKDNEITKVFEEKISEENIEKYLEDSGKTYTSNVFVLTSNKTSDSGTTTVSNFQRSSNGETVEKVSSNSTNSFGEYTREVSLPNSKIKFVTSLKKSYTQDNEKKFIEDETNIDNQDEL